MSCRSDRRPNNLHRNYSLSEHTAENTRGKFENTAKRAKLKMQIDTMKGHISQQNGEIINLTELVAKKNDQVRSIPLVSNVPLNEYWINTWSSCETADFFNDTNIVANVAIYGRLVIMI